MNQLKDEFHSDNFVFNIFLVACFCKGIKEKSSNNPHITYHQLSKHLLYGYTQQQILADSSYNCSSSITPSSNQQECCNVGSISIGQQEENFIDSQMKTYLQQHNNTSLNYKMCLHSMMIAETVGTYHRNQIDQSHFMVLLNKQNFPDAIFDLYKSAFFKCLNLTKEQNVRKIQSDRYGFSNMKLPCVTLFMDNCLSVQVMAVSIIFILLI